MQKWFEMKKIIFIHANEKRVYEDFDESFSER